MKDVLVQYEVVGARFSLATFGEFGRRDKVYLRGERFKASPYQIPDGFRDLVKEVPVEPPVQEETPKPERASSPPFRRRG